MSYMYYCRLFLLLLFTFICSSAFAATFIVTSNADAGPSTLRQALLDAAANGTATTDNITFNLPGSTLADITITLLSQLPDVTANVIIDGTTQPGLALGVSNAKIIIIPATPAQNFNAFNVSNLVGVNDAVEFYGLYITGFAPNQTGNGSAIVTNADCQLVIGAPGKGNVICANYCAALTYLQNAKIQSNFIGIEPDGETPSVNASVLYSSEDYNNLVIGGTDPLDGNVILCGNVAGIGFGGIANTPTSKSLTVENNFFGTDYKGTTALATSTVPFVQVNDAYSTLNILNNVFSAAASGIYAINKATLIVKGNYFGTDKTQTIPLSSGANAIIENTGINATIGGTTATDQNVFTNYQNPISAVNNCVTDVIQNIFYCNGTVALPDPSGVNFIRITTLNATSVAGDAPPGAIVQLYYTTTRCNNCNPNTCFATVTTNAAGKWQYNGTVLQNVMASSTVNNNTYGFGPFNIAQNEVTITNFDCHHGGSIHFTEPRQGNFQFSWTDAHGVVIGTSQNIDNLQPGTYSVQMTQTGTCPTTSGTFTIIDLTPKVFSSTFQLDCSNVTGYFTAYPSTGPGITVANYYWEDASGNVIATTQKVTGLAAGSYYLYVTDSNGCNSAKALYKVLPAAATPTIDDSNAVVSNENCLLSDGSITGIVTANAQGTSYGWSRTDGTVLGFQQTDLKNVPAGQYYFFIAYNFNCPPIKSRIFTVGSQNVLALNETAVAATSATCANANGSIKGIIAAQTTKYQWFDSNNNLVATTPTPDLVNVVSGSYYLVASNSYCSKQSLVYTVGNIPAVNNFQSTDVSSDATCDLSNGSITVTFDQTAPPKAYRWANSTRTTLASNAALTNQLAGNYQLYVTDNNGCESFYKSYTIGQTPLVQIVPGSAQITRDQCSLGVGAVSNILVVGGVPPYAYTWFNPAGQIISAVSGISNVKNGDYILQVTDATSCGVATQQYTVTNQTETLPPPQANDVQICSAGTVLLAITNPQPGYGYRLYNNGVSTTVLADQTNGLFNISVSGSRSYYVSEYSGDCESPRVEVKVIVGTSEISIPNTFTPNNDGINDFWVIKGIETYPYAMVQIFNRYGQKVFESKGYSAPFDGRTGGAILPVGVYYYIINLNSNCNLLSGSLTLLR